MQHSSILAFDEEHGRAGAVICWEEGDRNDLKGRGAEGDREGFVVGMNSLSGRDRSPDGEVQISVSESN